MPLHIICADCGTEYPPDTPEWICIRCGGLFEFEAIPRFEPPFIDVTAAGLWRYRAALPLSGDAAPVTLGEGWTPLVPCVFAEREVLFKLDFLMPTGSFKDRGSTVLVSALRAMGILHCLEDSSGNAAASLSAYCARAGIRADIYCPAYASPNKLAQIRAYGAQVHLVDGARENASRAVLEQAAQGKAYYASHYYNPYAMAGMKTSAWELWEQLGGRAPGAVVLPVGHGTNMIGMARGFRDLLDAGLIEKMPRIHAAQAASVAPLVAAFQRGAIRTDPVESRHTIAEGISIRQPARGRELLQVLYDTGGRAIAVEEGEIAAARADLARQGLFAEPTSATAAAALRHLDPDELLDPVVVSLSGSGLKGLTGSI